MAAVACSIVAIARLRLFAEAEEYPVSAVAVARLQRVQRPTRPAEPSATVAVKSLNAACAQRGKPAVVLGLQTSVGRVLVCRSHALDSPPIAVQLVMVAATCSNAVPACLRSRVVGQAFPTNVAMAPAVVSYSPVHSRRRPVDLRLTVAVVCLTAACVPRDKPAVAAV